MAEEIQATMMAAERVGVDQTWHGDVAVRVVVSLTPNPFQDLPAP